MTKQQRSNHSNYCDYSNRYSCYGFLLYLLPFLLLLFLTGCENEDGGIVYEIYSEQDTGALIEDTVYVNKPFTIKNYTLEDVTIFLNNRTLFIDRTISEDGTYKIDIVPDQGETFSATVILDSNPPSPLLYNYVSCDPSQIDVDDMSGVNYLYDGEEITQDDLSEIPYGRQAITLRDGAQNESTLFVHHVDCNPEWVPTELIFIPIISIALLFLVVFIERKVRT